MDRSISKKKKNFIAVFLVVSILGLSVTQVYASSWYNLTTGCQRYADIPNKNGCTNANSIAVDGNKAFCLKTSNSSNTSVLYNFNNYKNSSTFTTHTISSSLIGHGNGMTDCPSNDYLYIATNKNSVCRMKNNGTKITEYGLEVPENESISIVRGIAYYGKDANGNNLFLVRLSSGNSTNHKFGIGRITNGKFKVNKIFYVENTTPATIAGAQDIGYNPSTKQLVIITSDCVLTNAIESTYLTSAYLEKTSDGKDYYHTPIRCQYKYSGTSFTKRELEGIDFDTSGKLVFTMNVEGAKDGIFYPTANIK